MWKTYSYSELKGKIKVGDRVRADKDKRNPCNKLNNDGSNEAKITMVVFNYLYINSCCHEYAANYYLQLWTDKKTWQDLEHGDFVEDKDGTKRRVVDVLPHSVLLSSLLGDDLADRWWSFDELDKLGFKIVQSEPEQEKVTEMTVGEVEQKLKDAGVDVGTLKIIK